MAEKFKNFLFIYRVPLLFTGIGVLFLLIVIVMTVRSANETSDIVFTTAASEASSSAVFIKTVAIDVEGAVIRPGVYQLSADSRILDALQAAGGVSVEADQTWIAKNLNQAAKVVDGGKIYIPNKNEPTNVESHFAKATRDGQSGAEGLLGVSVGKVNINSASSAELDTLPGVGEKTVEKIIAGRPYQNLEELLNKKIVGQATFDKLKNLIVVQ